MNKKLEAIIGLVLIVLTFAIGRYTAPTKVETKTITVEIEKKVEDAKVNTVKIEVVKKDGSKIITTTTNSETKTNTDTNINKTATKVVENKHSSTNLSILAGVDISNPTHLVYGAAASKQLLGPITIGIWGMSNSTAGASLGVQF